MRSADDYELIADELAETILDQAREAKLARPRTTREILDGYGIPLFSPEDAIYDGGPLVVFDAANCLSTGPATLTVRAAGGRDAPRMKALIIAVVALLATTAPAFAEDPVEVVTVTEMGQTNPYICYWIHAGDLDGAYAAGLGYPSVILLGNRGWSICYSTPQDNTYDTGESS